LEWVKATNLVTRPLFQAGKELSGGGEGFLLEEGFQFAVGLNGENGFQDDQAGLQKGSSLLFVAPWRGRSLVGTYYQPYHGNADELRATARDVELLLNSINRAYPTSGLSSQDVYLVHAGLLPAASRRTMGAGPRLKNHPQIIDHRSQGAEGLLSVIGVKYTTARHVAGGLVDQVQQRLGRNLKPSQTSRQPLFGGEIEDYPAWLTSELARGVQLGPDRKLEANLAQGLVSAYGSAYPQVVGCLDAAAVLQGELTPNAAVWSAQARYAVHYEMAWKLSDVVMRRTGLGSGGHPGPEALRICTQAMANELGWSSDRCQRELEEVERIFTWDN
jgi:glycerol-3-phosphate dehydrogenase